MKLRMLDLLICPECQNPKQLKLEVYSEFRADPSQRNEAEVETGVLTCLACKRQYPIINGIPRMLPDNLISNLLLYHPDFFQKHSIKLPAPLSGIPLRGKSIADEIVQAKKRTLSRKPKASVSTANSFSFQWNVFSEMYKVWEENFLDYVHPLQPDFFDGKLGLDAGCGFGRHLYYATKFGAEMVGLDLSEAVESAYNNTKQLLGYKSKLKFLSVEGGKRRKGRKDFPPFILSSSSPLVSKNELSLKHANLKVSTWG